MSPTVLRPGPAQDRRHAPLPAPAPHWASPARRQQHPTERAVWHHRYAAPLPPPAAPAPHPVRAAGEPHPTELAAWRRRYAAPLPAPAAPAPHPVAAAREPHPAELAAWRRRLELDDQVRAAAATVVESRMPESPGPAGRAAVLRAGTLVAAAVAVAAGYIGLPLALAGRSLLGALPQALVLTAALVVLGTVGVLAVLRRTALVVPSRGGGRRDRLRRGHRTERPAGRTAPPDRRALPHAGATAPPHRPTALHGAQAPAPWTASVPAAAAGHGTPRAARRSRHRTRRR